MDLTHDWIDFLIAIAEEIRRETQPLFGIPAASEDVWLNEVRAKRNRIDAAAATILLRHIKKSGRSLTLVSEECGEVRFGTNSPEYLVVDEVDGTTNATHGIPFYATSLALSDGPRLSDVQYGVVMNLANGDTYTAERGTGRAKLNGSKLKPSEGTNLEEALVIVDATPSSGVPIEELLPLLRRCKHIRHYGAAALEMSLLAEGRIDAYLDLRDKLRITDIAASLLILREAGGAIIGYPPATLEAPLRPDEKVSFLAAGNSKLLEELSGSLRLKRT